MRYSIDMTELSDQVYDSFKKMIISASGWRKIFANDQDENSMCGELSDADELLATGIGYVFSKWALTKGCKVIATGRDTRPTGENISRIIAGIATEQGLEVRYLSVCAAPEIMSYVKKSKNIDGFIYVSASHNPAGHNGVKFGLGDGSVIGGKDSDRIISMFREFMENKSNYPKLVQILNNIKKELPPSEETKEDALQTYLDFNLSTAFPQKNNITGFIPLKKPAVIADMNGSARSLSIDRKFFHTLGIKYSFINDQPGKIAHGILPEGKNLEQAAAYLEQIHHTDKDFTLGYVPDNDGDRGNLVFIDKVGKAQVPDAQTVFALACTAELSFMEYSGLIVPDHTAVVVNCPTSMRIEHICQKFGVKVFRSEVGEANVVNLAAKLRQEGYTVRFLGEGSNGGNITWPATVRDPLNTIISIIKFVSITPLFEIWYKKSRLKTDFNFSRQPLWEDVISTLPVFQTTSTDDKLAKMRIKSTDHGKLKDCYETVFASQWNKHKGELMNRFGFDSWYEVNYIGTETIRGTGPDARKAGTKGGLKIIFTDKRGNDKAFIWMRGSGTEPVFRISADIESSSKEDERYLINWQHDMVEEADCLASV